MLFGAIVRSPYAHARIKSIDKSKALACRAWSRC
jgi:carbon-monoxide dehydrogenase large subunit